MVVVVNILLAHGGRARMEVAAETMVVVVDRKEDCVCLETGVQQTNNVCQTTGFRCIPFLCIPVSIPECVNSAGMIRHRNEENSRPSCQSSFLRNPPDFTGMTGFLQELGGHCKDLLTNGHKNHDQSTSSTNDANDHDHDHDHTHRRPPATPTAYLGHQATPTSAK